MAKGKVKNALAKAKAAGKKHFHHPKNILANAKDPAIKIGAATAGAIAAQKWLDFKTIFKDKYAKDPEGILFKHEGAIKVAGVVVTMAMVKTLPEWLKWVLIGVGIQGAIIEVKSLTKNKDTGESFIQQIGDAEFEQSINALVDNIKSVAEVNRTSVGAPNELSYNSNTGVGSVHGMGINEGEY